jgi:hypothetical protein
VVSGVYLAILEQGSNRHLVSIAVER